MMMKMLSLLLVLCVYVTSALTDPKLDTTWEQYKTLYHKTYDHESEERRRMIWEENLHIVRLHNLQYDLGQKTYSLGMNELSDRSPEEYKQMLGCQQQELDSEMSQLFRSVMKNEDLPKEVDWREKGFVTPVKYQGERCGSCYAFSATGSLEGQHFKKTGQLVSLSEQQIVDCSRHFDNDGCNGGFPSWVYNYIKYVGGIESEKSYPYIAKDDHCKFNKSRVAATCTGHVHLPAGNEKALQEAVATIGPISVSIDASHISFMHYRHGVYNEPNCSSKNHDHAVLVVGYGTENGVDYWLVKNSYGKSFGLSGYIKMSRNKHNQCGIATLAVYPTV